MKLREVTAAPRAAARVGTAVVAALALTACASSAADTSGGSGISGRLAVAVYGGPTTATWQKAFGEGFSKDFPDVALNISGVPNPSSLLYTQQGDVQFDLVLATASDVAQLAAGPDSRYTPIDPATLERSSHVISSLASETADGKWVGVPVALTYYGIVVNTDKHDPASVTSWADLADPKFKGQYLMNGPSFFATTDLPMFALANGGSATDLEPGFELLKQSIPNVKSVVSSLANAGAQMKSGDAGVAPFFFSQYSQLLDSGVPVKLVLPKEGGYASPLYLVMSPNTKNKDGALQFINSVLRADRQEGVQDASAYIPVVDDAALIDKLKERSGFQSAEDLMKQLTFPDYAYLAEHRDENTKRIEDLLAGGQ